MLKQYHLLKGHNLITTSQIQVSINKTQLTGIISDILASDNNTALLRAITPHLADKFEQFPEFTNVSLDSIDENGAGNITLKIPRSTTTSTEPVEEPTESEPTDSTFDVVDEVNLDD